MMVMVMSPKIRYDDDESLPFIYIISWLHSMKLDI